MPLPLPRWLLALALLGTLSVPADAVIKKLTPLKDVIGDAQGIVAATVERIDAQKPSVVFKFESNLKGKSEFESFAVNLKGDSFAKKDDHTKALLDRLVTGRKLILFVTKVEKTYIVFGFLEGTWFQVRGTVGDDGKTLSWAFLHCEPFFRRTFKGTTDELKDVIEKALSGKAAPPDANEKEEPGFGPLPEKKSSLYRSPTLFGVIPSAVLIAPLALVAALFPGVFARLAVVMKQWRAFLTISSINTTLAAVYFFFHESLPDRPIFSPRAFLLLVIGVTLVGTVWAGSRYRRMAAADPAVTATPSRTALLALLGLLALFGFFLVFSVWVWLGRPAGLVVLPMREFTALAAGLTLAVAYCLYRIATPSVDGLGVKTRLSLSGESVALFGTLAFSVGLYLLSSTAAWTGSVGEQGDAGETVGCGLKLADVRTMTFPGAYAVMSSVIAADDGKLYFGAESAGGTGSVWCVDPATGRPAWKFTNGGDLQPVYCTPTVAGGKVYVGEGLHTDSDRRLFCLNATNGGEVWKFKTESHTEGRPALAGDRLIFSAGDDGLICLDANTHEKRWHVPGLPHKLHVDTPPVVVGRRVFFGSGYNTLAMLAADVNTGDILWQTPSDLRSFGMPLTRGPHVYFGLGTGNLIEDLSTEKEITAVPRETTPKGSVVCLTSEKGEVVWRYDLPKSVHAEMAADRQTIFACCKDGFVYAIDRATGKLRWRRSVGPSCASGPVLATYANGAATLAVYAVSIDGRATALNPVTGEPYWVRNLGESSGKIVEVLSTPALVHATGGSKRTLYVGAKAENKNNGEKVATIFAIEDVIED
ncbi:outer membrane protein assembly factor BamB family protein [Limnoglobus roseus]|uniref:Serine/threonine protein kinase n=1 Tax=Limnoglobus roseus TaxID=2598579 RepID=A0A5C1AJR9_9BACT|nr:PQQ-binding-like beta-propeller repeat protein [Limnoglobus roseus]QEL18925.1 serine/threonine protein kinase [Limnoglobus roseus]